MADRASLLPAFALRRPVTVLMVFLALAAISLLAVTRIPLEMVPKGFTTPYLGVWVSYPNSTPEESEELIAIPFEEMLRTVSGLEHVYTQSSSRGVWVWLEFRKTMNMDLAYNQVRDRLDRIKPELPDQVRRLNLRRMGMEDEQTLWIAATYPSGTEDLYYLTENVIRPALEQVDGVASLEINGVDEKDVLIDLDLDLLSAHKVDLPQLISQLSGDNFRLSSGQVMEGGHRYQVRSIGQYQSIAQISQLAIAGSGFRLGDIASVRYAEPEHNWRHRVNGQQAIGIGVSKEALANTVTLSRDIMNAIETRIMSNPRLQEFEFKILFDQGSIIKESIFNLVQTGLWGGLFALIIMFYFLRRKRMTLLITLSIPFAVLVSLAVVYFLGWSLNVITMMGLMISIGMVVDSAIVVMESIFVRRQQPELSSEEVAVRGTSDVALAVTMSTLTTVVIFAPITIMGTDPMVSFFMKRIGVPVIVSLLASLMIALLFIPIASRHLGEDHILKEPAAIRFLRKRLVRLLNWVLNHRAVSLLAALVILFSMQIPLSHLNMVENEGNINDFQLRVRMPNFYKIQDADVVFSQVEEILERQHENYRIKATTLHYSSNRGRFHVFLQTPSRQQWYQHLWDSIKSLRNGEANGLMGRQEVMDDLKKRLPDIPGVRFRFGWRRSGGGDAAVQVQLSGPDTRRLLELAEEAQRQLELLPEIISTEVTLESDADEIVLVIDRELTDQSGVNTRAIAQTVSMALRGRDLPRYQDNVKEVPVRIRFAEEDRQTLDQLLNIPIATGSGEMVPLRTFVHWEVDKAIGNIHRSDGSTALAVKCFTEQENLEQLREQIEPLLKEFSMPFGYSWSLGDRFRRMGQVEADWQYLLVFSIVLVYMLMGILFESFILPVSILTAIPFALMGAYWALYITGSQLDVLASIGLVILVGVVVNNAIVLIDRVVQLMRSGIPRREALLQASSSRFRPVLMTALTTIFGLVPMAVGGAYVIGLPYAPMGRAMIGGLLVATFFTLVVVPLVFTLIDDLGALSAHLFMRLLLKKKK